jgi:iron-sulfur cluster repair protein YtfE (RIC family)
MANIEPFEILKKDHRKVEEIFEELEDTTERAEKTRQELFEELKTALDAHAELEESILYPALEKIGKTHDLTLEAVEEHAVVKTLLEELANEDETTEEWTAKIKVLKENVDHHVKEEEDELFPNAEQAMGKDDLLELAEELEAAKAEEA